MSLITECRSSQRQRPTCPRTRAQELSLTYTGTIKASLLRTFRDVFWMCRRALDLLLFRRKRCECFRARKCDRVEFQRSRCCF